MKSRFKTEQEKDAIIAEYLLGETTFRSIEKSMETILELYIRG